MDLVRFYETSLMQATSHSKVRARATAARSTGVGVIQCGIDGVFVITGKLFSKEGLEVEGGSLGFTVSCIA